MFVLVMKSVQLALGCCSGTAKVREEYKTTHHAMPGSANGLQKRRRWFHQSFYKQHKPSRQSQPLRSVLQL